MDPDPPMAEMAGLVSLGVRDLVRAFPDLASHPDRATECADAAVHQQRSLERTSTGGPCPPCSRWTTSTRWRLGVSSTAATPRIGDRIEGVAHRVWYAVVKEA